MKKQINNKGQNIINFQAVLAEDFSNTTMMLYSNKEITFHDNSEYDVMAKNGMFEKDKPFYGAKITDIELEAEEYLKENYNTELYNNKIYMKVIKRKYMKTVFPPMFFGVDGNRFDGVIKKGSTVNIRAEEEQYTSGGITYKKLVILGAKILIDNTSKENAQVYCNEIGGNTEQPKQNKETQSNTELLKELNELKDTNRLVLESMKALLDAVKETNKKIDVVEEENKNLINKIETLQNDFNTLQFSINNGEDTEGVISNDDFSELVNEENNNEIIKDNEELSFSDLDFDIPF